MQMCLSAVEYKEIMWNLWFYKVRFCEQIFCFTFMPLKNVFIGPKTVVQ